MKNISMIDVETTGLDSQKHEIIEIGLVVFESESPFKVLNTFNTKVKPEHPETGSSMAFQVNGYTEKEWADAPSLYSALGEMEEMCKGSTMLAYNVSFDWSFLQEAYKKTKQRSPFDYHRLDLFTVAWMNIPHEEIANWKLKTVCEKLGIAPEPEIHRAINGAKAGYDVYRSILDKQTLLPL
jgi:DNA polymerase III alpha subunit (gram-positive type)